MQPVISSTNRPIKCTINLPGSRSITYRALILAALADGVSEISGLRIDPTFRTILQGLHQLGIVVQLDESTTSCIITGCNGQFPKKQAAISCDNAKTCLHFLLAICAATPGVYYFNGSTALHALSLNQCINVLHRQGAQFIPLDVQKLPLTLIGADTLEGGELFFTPDIHPQFISALLMVAPFARSSFSFNALDNLPTSLIDLTCSLMSDFGVLVHRIHHGQLMVPVPQRYQARNYSIEPDFGFAIYFLAAAALMGGEITLPQVSRTHTRQPAAQFLSILEEMGCKIWETNHDLTIQGPSILSGVEVTMHGVTDSFLTLMVLAIFAHSPTRIKHAQRLQKHELTRLNAMKQELIRCGIQVGTGQNWIEVIPGKPRGGSVTAHHDDHIAMALSLLELKIPGFILNDDSKLIKTFPEFYHLRNKLDD